MNINVFSINISIFFEMLECCQTKKKRKYLELFLNKPKTTLILCQEDQTFITHRH